MKNKKLTVIVGIPAHNEEANIKNLLLSLLTQKQVGFIIKEIVVLSDGSDDKTVLLAKSVSSNLIRVIDGEKRRGKAMRQNEILKLIDSDVLILLDADVLPANNMLLRNLVKPISESKADLVGGNNKPLPPTTFLEKIINFSSKMKRDLFEKGDKVNSVYLCNGQVRAFSRELYKKLIWPADIRSEEDAYSYFFCITKGFKFSYQRNAKVLYRSPNTLGDHLKQSIRFIQSKRMMKKYFPKEVNKAYAVNKGIALRNLLFGFISNPILFSLYLLIYISSILLSFISLQNKQTWEISTSSKKL